MGDTVVQIAAVITAVGTAILTVWGLVKAFRYLTPTKLDDKLVEKAEGK